MFYDCTYRHIGDASEFAIAVGNVICHGLSMDPANYDLWPRKDEEILVIEYFNYFPKKKENPLHELVYRCKKNEVIILPNVLIIDGNDAGYNLDAKEKYLNICRAMPNQINVLSLRAMSVEQLNLHLGDIKKAKALHKILRESKEGYMRIQREYPAPDVPHEGWTYAFCEGFALFIDNPDFFYHTSDVQQINWQDEKSGTFTTLNSRYKFEFIEPEIDNEQDIHIP